MFADDRLIYVSADGSEELQNKMNRAFLMIKQWMNVNKLKIVEEFTIFLRRLYYIFEYI